MHLGIFAKTFPRTTLEETLDAIAERGITHVQFNMSCAGLPTLPDRLDENLCVWIARCFRDRGLTMAAISGTFNLCDPDESRLEEDLHRLGVLASACRWLDTRIITLCTGTRDPEDMWKWHPENVRRATWEALVRSMRSAVAVADRHEVTLAFEPERNNVVNSVARARMLLDRIGSPWLKLVIDPANLMTAEDGPLLGEILDEAFDWLGPDIVLAHAKNPPYVRIGDGMAAIREYLDRNDPGMIGSQLGFMHMQEWYVKQGIEFPEQLKGFTASVPSALFELYQFYFPYIQKLRNRIDEVALVMHGLAEEEVGVVQFLLRDLFRHVRGSE